eukprot:PhF_6_TR19741/c0_g1_i1/m.28807
MSRKVLLRCPLDWSIVLPPERNPDFIMSRFRATHHAILTYPVPPELLEKFFHHRFTCEAYANDEGVESALLSVVVSVCHPSNVGWLQRTIDPGPFGCINYRVVIQDKVFWRRSSWQFGTFTKSFYYSRIPRTVYGLPLYDAKVNVDAVFNKEQNKYSKFDVTCDGEKGIGMVNLSFKDTGETLLTAPTLEGFESNESALSMLALPTEFVTRGEANWVYRQHIQCTPFHPNVGELIGTPSIPFLTEQLGLTSLDLSKPHSVLLQDEVEDLVALQIESHIEDENEPNGVTAFVNPQGINNRIQSKVMTRATKFRDNVRGKSYEEQ